MSSIRTFISALLIVAGAVLTPFAVIGYWVQGHLLDSDGFVATFSPLADSPEIKTFVSQEVGDNVTTGIAETAGEGLASQIGQLASSATSSVVASPEFTAVWDQLLYEAHSSVIPMVAAPGPEESPLVLSTGPMIEALRGTLEENGAAWASLIPQVDFQFAAATVPNLDQARLWYRFADGVGQWGPAVAAGLILLGLIVARRRSTALFWAGLITAITCGLGYYYVSESNPLAQLSPPVGTVIWGQVSGPLTTWLAVVALSAAAVGCVGLIGRLASR